MDRPHQNMRWHTAMEWTQIMRGEGRVVAAVCHCCTDSPSSYYYYHHRSAGFKASEASELEYGFRKEAPLASSRWQGNWWVPPTPKGFRPQLYLSGKLSKRQLRVWLIDCVGNWRHVPLFGCVFGIHTYKCCASDYHFFPPLWWYHIMLNFNDDDGIWSLNLKQQALLHDGSRIGQLPGP